MLPSSPMAPFTPSVLAQLPNPEPEPRSDGPVEPDQNPLSPMAPVAVGTQGRCCGDTDGGGGGGSQTPWTSDINAAGFTLENVAIVNAGLAMDLQVVSPGRTFINGATVTIQGSSVSLTHSNYGSMIQFYPDAAIAIQGYNLRIPNLPTSSAGLSSGFIWNNSGVLNIVP